MGYGALVLRHTSKVPLLASHVSWGRRTGKITPPRLNSWRGEREGEGEGRERGGGGVEPGGVILSVLLPQDTCVPEAALY